MSPHVATVTQLCLKFMCFDPNYNYDDDEDEEEGESMEVGDALDEGLSSCFLIDMSDEFPVT